MKRLAVIISLFFFFSCEEAEIKPPAENLIQARPLTLQEAQLVQAGNQFARQFLNKLDQVESENYFVSPLSIGCALGMVMNGAKGDTQQGIQNTLDFQGLTQAEINQSFRDLIRLLLELDPNITIGLANSVWYRDDLTVDPVFSEVMKDYFDAQIAPLDFARADANDIINAWVEGKTEGRITELLDEVSPMAVMFLVNAIYFKADWTYQFDVSATRKDMFYPANGNPTQVDMMYSDGVDIKYWRDQSFQYIDIPYAERQFSMTFLLPEPDQTINGSWENIDWSALQQFESVSDTLNVKLYIPRFELNYKKELKDILSLMGMEKAFSNQADLSGLFTEDLDLFISQVIHQSYLKVDEKGTEAAAATSVGIELTSIDPARPKIIKVDRPFALLIREKHTNSVLFAGRINFLD